MPTAAPGRSGGRWEWLRRSVLRIALVLRLMAIALWAVWCTGALWYAPLPGPLPWLLVVGYLGAWAATRRWRWVRSGVLALTMAITIAWLTLMQPRQDRDWTPDQARLPTASVSGSADGRVVTVRNVRDCDYRGLDDYDARWEDRSYDLDRLRTLWLVVEPFHPGSALAHTFLSFGFDDGRYVAISVEIRKERGERFSPVAGLFRRYELMYVVADERDAIRLRANLRHDDVYLFPLRATPAQAALLFQRMLARANALAARPEFYHTLSATCATSIMRDVDAIWPGTVPWTLEVALPGRFDLLARRLGLLDGGDAFDRARYRINERAAAADADPDFSARIRDQAPDFPRLDGSGR